MEQDSPYILKGQKNIAKKVSLLAKKNLLFSVHVADSDHSFMTTIVNVDLKNHKIAFGFGPNDNQNERLLAEESADFSTELSGVKVCIPGTSISKSRTNGQETFSIPIPDTMLWEEKREYYRVRSPLSKESYCTIALVDREPVKLQLYDISITGFSLVCEDNKIIHELALIQKNIDCNLVLENTADDKISFVIRHTEPVNEKNPEMGYKIGCQYLKIAAGTENKVFHYVQELERESIRKS